VIHTESFPCTVFGTFRGVELPETHRGALARAQAPTCSGYVSVFSSLLELTGKRLYPELEGVHDQMYVFQCSHESYNRLIGDFS
jgi:hypothetical protein